MVEENGTVDPLAPSPDPPAPSSVGVTNTQPHLVAATNIVQLTLPTHTQAQAQVGGYNPPRRTFLYLRFHDHDFYPSFRSLKDDLAVYFTQETAVTPTCEKANSNSLELAATAIFFSDLSFSLLFIYLCINKKISMITNCYC